VLSNVNQSTEQEKINVVKPRALNSELTSATQLRGLMSCSATASKLAHSSKATSKFCTVVSKLQKIGREQNINRKVATVPSQRDRLSGYLEWQGALPFWAEHSVSLSYEILSPDKIELSTPRKRSPKGLVSLHAIPVRQGSRPFWAKHAGYPPHRAEFPSDPPQRG